MIPKKDMEGGIYYKGICRNAYVAEWDGKKEEFVYMRYKFGFMKDTIEQKVWFSYLNLIIYKLF